MMKLSRSAYKPTSLVYAPSKLSFSSPEAALLLVSTKNRDLWPGPTPEVRITLRMLRFKSEKSDWFWSQSIVFRKLFKTGMSLDLARGRDSWCWPKGAWPLGARMQNCMFNILLLHAHISTKCRLDGILIYSKRPQHFFLMMGSQRQFSRNYLYMYFQMKNGTVRKHCSWMSQPRDPWNTHFNKQTSKKENTSCTSNSKELREKASSSKVRDNYGCH